MKRGILEDTLDELEDLLDELEGRVAGSDGPLDASVMKQAVTLTAAAHAVCIEIEEMLGEPGEIDEIMRPPTLTGQISMALLYVAIAEFTDHLQERRNAIAQVRWLTEASMDDPSRIKHKIMTGDRS